MMLFVLLTFVFSGTCWGLQTKPDIVLIVLDDVGWEDLTPAETPSIVAYSGLGRTYTRAYGCPVCSPSRTAMLNGVYPHRDFVGTAINTNDVAVGAPTTRPTVPEVLGCAGYRTALFGKSHVASPALIAESEQARVLGFEDWLAGAGGNPSSHYSWTRVDNGKRSTETTYTNIAVNEAFKTWWMDVGSAQPRYAVVSFMAPHEPFEAPPASLLPPGYVTPNTNRGRYEAALRALDTLLLDMLCVIDLGTTHVVLVCDNGTAHQVPPPNAQSQGYKLTMFEGGVRTPLCWWGPGITPGVDTSLVQNVDLPATLLDVAGVAPHHGFDDSISFAPTLTGGAGARNYVFLTRFSANGGQAAALSIDYWAVLRADGWKLLFHDSAALSDYELYNLAIDPWENFPIAPGAQPTITADLEWVRAQALGPFWPY
jgi:arylsulfatase A-like enzyme